MQEYNREALARLRSLLSEQLSQSPATEGPYPPRAAGRRRRLGAAKPLYATQCLYEPPPDPSPPPPPSEGAGASPSETAGSGADSSSSAASPDGSPSSTQTAGGDSGAATARRQRQLAQDADGGGGVDAAAPPPSTPPAEPTVDALVPPSAPPQPPTGTCYLNPAALASPDMPDPETPVEVMLLKAAWTAYQCSFENRKGRCGTYRHEPYDCRWQADQGRCAVPSDYLLPRLLTYLHCRDDTTVSPFWDRCYQVGVVLTGGDNDWCGQSDGNLARCYWFPARNDSESDMCGPSPAGGVASRDQYDELVASMRSGTWQREWFGECPTAELVYTIKSACNYTTAEDCEADPSCSLRPDLPVEYGMCRLADGLIWDALFGTESALFNATAAAMAECAAASGGLEECMAAGSLTRGSTGGDVVLDASGKFGDLVDLVFIEEVTPGAAGPGARPPLRLALIAAGAALLAAPWLAAWRPGGLA
ncbi:hypothetical protein GPECTOR_22g929 [Gonium pectorale]|uniref:Uncharacterized protein n=1 Tax=Gonium pectorale TaxID=33097 RepID=A0A150GI62_GONPE|nr:hypothetical protein GPECTOR_22g929 [Gonium pectorale]|eukprot:KXZ49335.1 hypothetical protein GPECTOR_22g929 [Gonium pectorale]